VFVFVDLRKEHRCLEEELVFVFVDLRKERKSLEEEHCVCVCRSEEGTHVFRGRTLCLCL